MKFAYHDQIVAIDQNMCNFQTSLELVWRGLFPFLLNGSTDQTLQRSLRAPHSTSPERMLTYSTDFYLMPDLNYFSINFQVTIDFPAIWLVEIGALWGNSYWRPSDYSFLYFYSKWPPSYFQYFPQVFSR